MSLTDTVIAASVFLLALIDVWLIMKKGKYSSISAHIIRGSKQYPLVVLIFGVLLGHLFWSMDTFDYAEKEYLVQKCKELLSK